MRRSCRFDRRWGLDDREDVDARVESRFLDDEDLGAVLRLELLREAGALERDGTDDPDDSPREGAAVEREPLVRDVVRAGRDWLDARGVLPCGRAVSREGADVALDSLRPLPDCRVPAARAGLA